MTDQKILTILNKNPQQRIHLLMNLYGGAVSTICQNFLYDFPESDIEEAIADTCLENMKEPDKSVFLYRYFYGYKIADIAAILNLTIKQVENILYRGKERLRKDLQERGVSYE